MRRVGFLFLVTIFLIPLALYGQVKTDWVRRYGGVVGGSDEVAATVCDAAGNVYVTGTSDGNGTGEDYVTVKYDSLGERLWVARYDGFEGGYDEPAAIAVDASGNVCVTGGSEAEDGSEDYATVKYSPSGAQLWAARYPGPGDGDDFASAVAVDATGNVYVTGSSEHYSEDRSDFDYVTIKYDAWGNQLWLRRYDSGSADDELDDMASGIAVDHDGDVYVTGYSDTDTTGQDYVTVKYNHAGTPQWTKHYDGPMQEDDCPSAIVVDQWDCAFVTGYCSDSAGEDYATIRYAPYGDTLWVRRYAPGFADYEATALTLDAAGNTIVTGNQTGGGMSDCVATVKYDANGSQVWDETYQGDGLHDVCAAGVACDDSGNIYVAGTTGTAENDDDYVTLKYGPNGVRQWRVYYDGAGNGDDEAVGLAVPGANRVYVAGSSDGVTGNTDYAVVRYHPGPRDVGVSTILSPPELVYPQHPVVPACSVCNYGGTVLPYSVRMKIGAGYDQRVFLDEPDTMPIYVTFPAWSPDTMGPLVVTCSTELSADRAPGNDRQTVPVEVVPGDVGVTDIPVPDSFTPEYCLVPACSVLNYAGIAVEYPVRMKIGSDYDSTVYVPEHGEGTHYVTFPPWSAGVLGTFALSCSTQLRWDGYPGNDRMGDSVRTVPGDVGPVALVSPDTAFLRAPVAPVWRVHNYRGVPAGYRARMQIGDGYDETAWVARHDSGDLSVRLPAWIPGALGRFAVRCSTMMLFDQDSSNDVAYDSITVVPGLWVTRAKVPWGRHGKQVKYGGCLAASLESDTPCVHALKGNSSLEFLRYIIPRDSWQYLESVPAIGASGKKKLVKRGASMCEDGKHVYAAKGNNTLEFWRYDPSLSNHPWACGLRSPGQLPFQGSYPWTQLPDIPVGYHKLTYGSGSVIVHTHDTTFVYLLKGSSTCEFYRYNAVRDTWETRCSAPAGLSGKGFGDGSCLATDGATRIYALKASYGEFFLYDVAADTWGTGPILPVIGKSGRKKRVGAGAGLACTPGGRDVYALKGGNTREFWKYSGDSGQWMQRQDVPSGVSGKNVNYGGALVAGLGGFYALKGNSSLEFYCFMGDSGSADEFGHPGSAIEGGLTSVTRFDLAVYPNPFVRNAAVCLALPKAGNVDLKLFDVTGRQVAVLLSGRREPGEYQVPLLADRLALAAGVYFIRLRLEGENTILDRKVVLE